MTELGEAPDSPAINVFYILELHSACNEIPPDEKNVPQKHKRFSAGTGCRRMQPTAKMSQHVRGSDVDDLSFVVLAELV